MMNKDTNKHLQKQLPTKNPKALLLINFHSQYGKKCLPEVIWCLENTGFKLILEYPESPQIVCKLIKNYKDEVDLVIIAAGDTVLNSAADALVETQLPLGIIPLGTTNNLAKNLGIPKNLHQACQFIANGNIEYIDLGWVNGKYFINFATLGLSTDITTKLIRKDKFPWSIFTYLINVLQILYSSRPFSAEIHHRHGSIPIKTVHIGIHNGHNKIKSKDQSLYIVKNNISSSNQGLNIHSLKIEYRWQIISLLKALRYKNHHNSYENIIHSGENLKIFTYKPVPINTDGEITAYTPAEFRLAPQALPVLIPKN
ncbi:MAG: lipid kinase [Mastigocoleus sp.]